jgi:hypothetical protein
VTARRDVKLTLGLATVDQLRATLATVERLDAMEADERVFALLGRAPRDSWRGCGRDRVER